MSNLEHKARLVGAATALFLAGFIADNPPVNMAWAQTEPQLADSVDIPLRPTSFHPVYEQELPILRTEIGVTTDAEIEGWGKYF